MTSKRHRANFISSILRVLLVVNILLFVLATIGMLFTGSSRSVYIFGTLSCSCLMASVGFQLLIRWQRLGFYLNTGIYILASTLLYLYFPNELSRTFGIYGTYLPFTITGIVFLLLCILIFAIKDSKTDENCWSQMSDGVDIKHFRHIYQLTSILLLIMGGVIYILPSTKANKLHKSISLGSVQTTREISYELLDSVNVTLDEIILIEPMIDSIPPNLQLKYNKRIFALKHLILSGIMAKEHNPNDIINISKVHFGEFSKNQQRILDWYLALPKESQLKWIECPPVNNLQDFKLKLTETLEK